MAPTRPSESNNGENLTLRAYNGRDFIPIRIRSRHRQQEILIDPTVMIVVPHPFRRGILVFLRERRSFAKFGQQLLGEYQTSRALGDSLNELEVAVPSTWTARNTNDAEEKIRTRVVDIKSSMAMEHQQYPRHPRHRRPKKQLPAQTPPSSREPGSFDSTARKTTAIVLYLPDDRLNDESAYVRYRTISSYDHSSGVSRGSNEGQ
ncbi:hypothetical protein F4820DRAFT_447631 [Hypoxylon rubiginosum]|uniref:Uncharacterized protein n=1 Tax=Hypoxylon rubiginosum TaxID=110542 RepID=A0ACB9Z3P8_9PEZI|nr:hypothetical protein F4820DRAFT_447631 [Hypoxylon rubiginosum]